MQNVRVGQILFFFLVLILFVLGPAFQWNMGLSPTQVKSTCSANGFTLILYGVLIKMRYTFGVLMHDYATPFNNFWEDETII